VIVAGAELVVVIRIGDGAGRAPRQRDIGSRHVLVRPAGALRELALEARDIDRPGRRILRHLAGATRDHVRAGAWAIPRLDRREPCREAGAALGLLDDDRLRDGVDGLRAQARELIDKVARHGRWIELREDQLVHRGRDRARDDEREGRAATGCLGGAEHRGRAALLEREPAEQIGEAGEHLGDERRDRLRDHLALAAEHDHDVDLTVVEQACELRADGGLRVGDGVAGDHAMTERGGALRDDLDRGEIRIRRILRDHEDAEMDRDRRHDAMLAHGPPARHRPGRASDGGGAASS